MRFILKSFLIWRILLFIILVFAVKFIPNQENFLGGKITNYLANPYLWSHANFDGEHLLSIVKFGYTPLTYFFFPLYPYVIRLFGSSILSGIIVSNLCFLISLFGLYKLIKIDYKRNTARLVITILLLFPTSFYFGMVYTESLFLALIVWSFYFIRKNNFLIAGLLIAFASATRLVGVTVILPLICEIIVSRTKKVSDIFSIFLSTLGIIFYMIYLKTKTGDYLNFYHAVSVYGEQRSESVVALPQVFYRYIFKIIPNFNYSHFPSYFPGILEIITATSFLLIIIFSFRKLRFSYWLFLLFGYLLPTLSGSFSSLPRYVLVLFPAFIYLAKFFEKKPILKYIYFVISLLTLIICYAMFSRGYWIS